MGTTWDIYFTLVQELPAAFVLDLAAFTEQSAAKHPMRLIITVPFRQPDQRGFPGRAEDAALNDIEDALNQHLLPLGAQYVARVTAHGRRDFIFYAPAAVNAQAAVQKAASAFPGYAFDLRTDADPTWSFYREILYPSDREKQCMQDRRVLDNLRNHGDTLEIPRFLNHWAYFPTAEARQAFVDQTVPRGFVTRSLHEVDKGDLLFCARIERKDSVQLRDINAVTLELFDVAQSCGGRYDGWECKVITSPDDAKEY